MLQRFETNRIFNDEEAWLLFRIAAFGEAVGWTLLIIGILLREFLPSHSQIPVMLAGQVHGMLFLFYAFVSIILYPSLKWSRPKAIVALLASVPPYGSLLFEQWAAFVRHNSDAKSFGMIAAYQVATASLDE